MLERCDGERFRWEAKLSPSARGARDEKGEVMFLAVKPGDRVLSGKRSGTEVKIDGEKLPVIREILMMGVLESAAAPVRKAA